jgi:hypothetical protein
MPLSISLLAKANAKHCGDVWCGVWQLLKSQAETSPNGGKQRRAAIYSALPEFCICRSGTACMDLFIMHHAHRLTDHGLLQIKS